MTDAAVIDELKAIAHPLRFQILQALRGRELNVGEIEQTCGIGQPSLSQQLGVLRRSGLVDTRKDAKLVFYCLNIDRLSELGALIGGFDRDAIPASNPERPVSPGVAHFARMS